MRVVRPAWGFSLVEVVIALAVTGFAVTAVIGLMSVALASSRSAQDETLIASMSSALAGDLRSAPFAHAETLLAQAPVVYFNSEGARIAPLGTPLSESSAAGGGAVYRCTLGLTPEPSTRRGSNTVLLHRLTMSFSWPVGGDPRETRSLHASLLQD